MKKANLFFLGNLMILLIGQSKSLAQIDISIIPDSILSNASAVVFDHQETLEINNKYLLKRNINSTTIITKENESGHYIYIPYDKHTKIDDLEITVCSLNGKKRKTIKQKDMLDQALVDHGTLASDARMLMYRVHEKEVPVVVKLQCSKTSKESFTIESFKPIINEKTAVLSSNFTVINHDLNNPLRFSNNAWPKPSVEVTSTFKKYSFQLKNITTSYLKVVKENHDFTYIIPILENFQMDGVEGSLNSWSRFGSWFAKLGEGTDILDERSKAEIKNVIGNSQDKKEIIEKLYKYLQQNMRYVSIQLGIGGFKPMSAQDVHNYKYGDCKALSNYMKTILKVVDIPANYIIICAGKYYIKPETDFPQNIFNHAIVAVPIEQDTVFLECTSTNDPVGYLGTFTGDRKALWIDGENSSLVKTKSYSFDKNIIENTFEIDISKDEVARIGFKQKLSGLGIEHHGYYFTSKVTNEKFREHLEKKMPEINNVDVITRSYNDDKYFFECKLASPKNVMKSGSRFFVKLKIDKLPTSIEEQKHQYSVKNGYIIFDNYNINIPVGCHIENAPKTKKMESKFVDFDIETINSPSQITVQRVIKLKPLESPDENKIQIEEAIGLLKKAMEETVVINCKS